MNAGGNDDIALLHLNLLVFGTCYYYTAMLLTHTLIASYITLLRGCSDYWEFSRINPVWTARWGQAFGCIWG